VSISPTFYTKIFGTKVLSKAFLKLHYGFEIFWRKNIGAKGAHKMLMRCQLSTFYAKLLRHPKSIKIQSSRQYYLRFWDLHE